MISRLAGSFLLVAFIAISSWYVETQYTAVSIRRALNDDAVDGNSCRFFFNDILLILNAKNGWSKQDPTGNWKIEIAANTDTQKLELNVYEKSYLWYFWATPTTTYQLHAGEHTTLLQARRIIFYPKNKQNDNWPFIDGVVQCEAGDNNWEPSKTYEYLFHIIKNKAQCIFSTGGSDMTINTQNSWKYEGSGWKINMVANQATKQLELVIFHGRVEIRWVLTVAAAKSKDGGVGDLYWDINGKLKEDWKGSVICIVGQELKHNGGWRYDVLLQEVPLHYERRSAKRKTEVPDKSCFFTVDSYHLLIENGNQWKKKDFSETWEIEMFVNMEKTELVVRIKHFSTSSPVGKEKTLGKPSEAPNEDPKNPSDEANKVPVEKHSDAANELYWKFSQEDDDGILRCKYVGVDSSQEIYEWFYNEVSQQNVQDQSDLDE